LSINFRYRTQAKTSSTAAAVPLQMLNNLVASYALSRAISQQQASMSVLQPGSSLSTVNITTPKPANISSTPPISTFDFNVTDVSSNATKTSAQLPVVQSQEQVSKNAQSNPQQQQHEQNSVASILQVSKKEEHTKKLKAAFEEQQKALRMAYEKSLQDAQEREENTVPSKTPSAGPDSEGAKPTSNAIKRSSDCDTSLDTISPAEQLQRSYEAHLASLQRAEQQASLNSSSKASSPTSSQTESASGSEVGGDKTESKTKTKRGEKSRQKKSQDEEAGAILLGFLNSLRESFEDAVEAKDGKKETVKSTRGEKVPTNGPETESIPIVHLESSTVMTEASSDSSTHISERQNCNDTDLHVRASDPITSLSHFQSSKRKVKPASVTETSSSTSSQPTIEQPSSSQEDSSKSDKMGHSSSEESEKEITASMRSSKGPPRKRLKGFHEPHEFTRENLMAHSKRMDMECRQSGDTSSSDEQS
jgi:hypothetical protein